MPVRIIRTIYRRDGTEDITTSDGHADFSTAVEVARAQVSQYETQLLADIDEPNYCDRTTHKNTAEQRFSIKLLADPKGFEVMWDFEAY